MKKLLLIPILVLAVSLILPIPAAASNPQFIGLIAGQDEDNPVGEVKVWNDSSWLYVEFIVPEDGWEIVETHLAVGTSLGDIPTNKKGKPVIGHFPEVPDSSSPNLVVYQIPLSWGDGTKLYIAAHAVVRNADNCQEETAWGAGPYCGGRALQFVDNGGSWATYFYYWVDL